MDAMTRYRVERRFITIEEQYVTAPQGASDQSIIDAAHKHPHRWWQVDTEVDWMVTEEE